MSAIIVRRRKSLLKLAISKLVFRASTYLCLAFSSSGLLAQFDSPQAPLPPPAPAKKEDASKLNDLQTQIDEFQQSMAELHKTDPAKAERMMRDFTRAISVIKSRDQQNSSPNRHALPTSKYRKKTPNFETAKYEIQFIRDLGDTEQADEFAKSLAKLESAMAGEECELPSTERPEVHYVKLNSGSTLPDEFRTKANRFSKSYAEVHLQRTGTPIILVLECNVPTLWNLKLADNVDVFALIVESTDTQKVIGIEHPLLLDMRTAAEKRLFDYQNTGTNSRGELLAGSQAVTKYEAQRYEQPIVLGPASKEWRTAFVANQTTELIDTCRQQRRLLSAKKLNDLRYSASFSTEISPSALQFCRGEFDIVGPEAASLVPHQGRANRYELAIPDDDEVLNFGLSTSGMLVTIQQGGANHLGAKTTSVPMDPKVLASRARIRAVAYDSKRRRLLCATTESTGAIVALDIESGTWSKVGLTQCPVIGMAYSPATDEIWAVGVRVPVIQSKQSSSSSNAQFLRLSAEGQIVSEKPISRPLQDSRPPAGYSNGNPNMLANLSLQLIVAGDYAVLTGARSQWAANFGQRPQRYQYVIDADTCELVHDGPVQLHDNGRIIKRNGNVDGFSALSNITSMLAKLKSKSDASDLSQLQRDKLQQELVSVRQLLAGEEPTSKENSRAYFVGSFTSGDAKIKVTDTSCPVTLVLASSQALRWNVDIAPGVTVEKIIAEGREKPVVKTSVAGVPVEYHFGAKALRLTSDNRHLHPERLKAYVVEKIGVKLSAVTMMMRQNPRSLIQVGPEDGPMRLQLAHSKLTSLVSELDAERRSELIESIQGESFFAMHRGKLPGAGDQPPAARPTSRVFWNEFSIRGPKIGRSTVASQAAAFGALNEDGTKLYSADLHRLYIKDLKTGNTESITLRTIARHMGRISGMHYVADEKQLLIDTQTGIWSVDVATKKPKLLHAKYSQRTNTSAYSAKHKCWFALEQERRSNSEVTRIRRYNEHYAPIDQVVLSKAITRGARSFSSSIPPQLVSVGDHLAVIDYLQKREVVRINGRSSSRSNYVGSITVFDPSTGEIVHEAELEPCVEFRDLSPPQLQALWQKLSLAGDQDAEALMWQLASGGVSTFEFLKDKFPKLVRDSEIDVDALVEKLDDNRFSVRDRAYRTLRDAGSQIEPDLRAMIQGDVTPEVRERIESLIAQWNIGAPQNAEQLQKVRGIEVLYRIGDKDSRQLLDSLTSDEQASYVRVQATRSLKGESVVTDGFQNPAVRLQNQLFVPR